MWLCSSAWLSTKMLESTEGKVDEMASAISIRCSLASACTSATASLGPGASGASASSEPRPKKRRMAGPKSQRAKEVESLEELQRQSRQHL